MAHHEHQVRVLNPVDLIGDELEVVRLRAGRSEVRDGDALPPDCLGCCRDRVERRDDARRATPRRISTAPAAADGHRRQCRHHHDAQPPSHRSPVFAARHSQSVLRTERENRSHYYHRHHGRVRSSDASRGRRHRGSHRGRRHRLRLRVRAGAHRRSPARRRGRVRRARRAERLGQVHAGAHPRRAAHPELGHSADLRRKPRASSRTVPASATSHNGRRSQARCPRPSPRSSPRAGSRAGVGGVDRGERTTSRSTRRSTQSRSVISAAVRSASSRAASSSGC